jgi:DNA polymerase-4
VWTEPILHVDMDSFFVEVERLDEPRLRDIPVAVGGGGPRGVIASASYEARSFGVRSAQPTSTARRLCPHLTLVPTRHGRYSEVSSQVFAIFRAFTPLVEGLSLDEAFLDVSGLRLHYDSPVQVAESVRGRIRSELRLPASVGVASVKFVAKLASERAKPDGILHVPAEGVIEFLHGLPVTAVWGVGPATHAALARLGVETVGDIAAVPRSALVAAVGPTTGDHLHQLSNGCDPRPVVPDSSAKSISVEETFESDLVGVEVMETALLNLAERLSGRLRRAGLRARTITLKLRYEDFTRLSRSVTVPGGTNGSRQLFLIAVELLSALGVKRPVRLLGLGGGSFEDAEGPQQMDLESRRGWDRVEEAVAEVRDRFGDGAVTPARLVRRREAGRDKDVPS